MKRQAVTYSSNYYGNAAPVPFRDGLTITPVMPHQGKTLESRHRDSQSHRDHQKKSHKDSHRDYYRDNHDKSHKDSRKESHGNSYKKDSQKESHKDSKHNHVNGRQKWEDQETDTE